MPTLLMSVSLCDFGTTDSTQFADNALGDKSGFIMSDFTLPFSFSLKDFVFSLKLTKIRNYGQAKTQCY